MNPTPFNQFLSNNQKEIIAGVVAIIVAIIGGVFLLISVAMNKDTPAPVVHNYTYRPTYNVVVNEAAPPVAHEPRAARAHKRPRKQHPKPATQPLPRPSCPCADSTKAGV
ncbi:hypothetical protein Q5H92_19490 [Hymenobacter sp. M29]|uniref:Uncharacterized protein n=1 Tax=Hymenobacter mellowenesis TaxID=3063995 RepID=A0ABT9AFD5_9BACT|nr:hypothetical protein [Hymenobacter sp. M29]MDO7848560.1 hypothetical protein [Hymenobacter sp. M29]